MIHRILVLLDSSSVSEEALMEAMKIGKIYQSTIICIHPVARHDPLQVKAGQDLVARAEGFVKSAGLGFDFRIVEDDPGPAVVKAASRLDADLVVMGSLGEEGLKRHVVSSAVDYVVRKAPCDVLVVKSDRPVF
ncbi:MAG TPA: universal stress protein [Candidatus Methanomethylicus sp.]|nr:universal stress protein [Candidatus Methanomethylicus sp.]